jgi:hypothetical protein
MYYGDGIGGFTTVVKEIDALGTLVEFQLKSPVSIKRIPQSVPKEFPR